MFFRNFKKFIIAIGIIGIIANSTANLFLKKIAIAQTVVSAPNAEVILADIAVSTNASAVADAETAVNTGILAGTEGAETTDRLRVFAQTLAGQILKKVVL